MPTPEDQGRERRRDRRYPLRARAVVLLGKRELATSTRDVSFTGAFIESDTPALERQLVKLRFTLPPEGDALEVMGMLARFVPRSEGGPGMGVQFYATSKEQQDRWRRLVRFAATSGGAPATLPDAPQPLPVRRAYPRHPVTFQVLLKDGPDLVTMVTRNVSQGGVFVATAVSLPPGTPLRVTLVHPRTGDHFELDAVVRWNGDAPVAGLGLEFTDFAEARREALVEFMRSEIPVEKVELVPADDLPLAVAAGERR